MQLCLVLPYEFQKSAALGRQWLSHPAAEKVNRIRAQVGLCYFDPFVFQAVRDVLEAMAPVRRVAVFVCLPKCGPSAQSCGLVITRDRFEALLSRLAGWRGAVVGQEAVDALVQRRVPVVFQACTDGVIAIFKEGGEAQVIDADVDREDVDRALLGWLAPPGWAAAADRPDQRVRLRFEGHKVLKVILLARVGADDAAGD